MKHSAKRIEFGDFQTPIDLAQQCCRVIAEEFGDPSTVIEPTCGKGSFVVAAARQFECKQVVGFELNDAYRRLARRNLKSLHGGAEWSIQKRDFFACDWTSDRDAHEGPVLYVGNPPWATNSQLGLLGSNNLPAKANVGGVRGIDAMTGRSNFDIAESILQSLLAAMRPEEDALAMLVKTATARRLLQHAWQTGRGFSHASIRSIDAKQSFGVNVDACLLMLKLATERPPTDECWQSTSLTDCVSRVAFGSHNGVLVADPARASATDSLTRQGSQSDQRLIWRSGVKHDLSDVVELKLAAGCVQNQSGKRIDLERDMLYPLAKGADVANGRTECIERRILITQSSLGETSSSLTQSHPKTWDYLRANAARFTARKSSIYRNRDPFALFGIGPYTFAPWKLAICGLYKRLTFSVLGPIDGRPVMVDDTCYFLPLENRDQAELARLMVDSPEATAYFNARIFWDAKRPITAQLLRSLDLRELAAKLGRGGEFQRLFGCVAAKT